MSLTEEQRRTLELMRTDNASAGFPFAASEFWNNEAGKFEQAFEVSGIANIAYGYINTRFSGITMNDPRLYEWFISTFYHLLRSRDHLKLLDRFEATLEEAPTHTVLQDGLKLEFGLPVTVAGRRISADLLFSIHDFYNLCELNPAVATDALIVGDLGAGWGRLAHLLLQVNPRIRYVLFDIPESLLVSSTYLPQLLPGVGHSRYAETRTGGAFPRDKLMGKALWLLASQDLARLPASGVDLMVNVASFQEMNADQINRYLEIFDEIAFGGHVYLRNNYFGAGSRVDEYRFPEGWLRRFSRTSPFSTQFYEAGWRVT
jgi:putative sugar O-methyltransferase